MEMELDEEREVERAGRGGQWIDRARQLLWEKRESKNIC